MCWAGAPGGPVFPSHLRSAQRRRGSSGEAGSAFPWRLLKERTDLAGCAGLWLASPGKAPLGGGHEKGAGSLHLALTRDHQPA